MTIPARVLVTAANLHQATGDYTVEFPDNTTHVISFPPLPPGRKSVDHDWTHPDIMGDTDCDDHTAKRCADLASRNKEKSIGKTLFGNGTGPRTAATAKNMADMHPRQTSPLSLYSPRVEQLSVSTETCDKHIRSKCKAEQSSIGFFGWAPGFLYPIAGAKGTKNDFIATDAAFTSLLAAGRVPPAIGYPGYGRLRVSTRIKEFINFAF